MNPKLLSIIPKLVKLSLSQWQVRRLLEQYKGVSRSCQLILRDDGDETAIWIGIEDGEIKVKIGRYPATNTVTMDVDVFIDIVKGRVDFRTALWHGAIQVESHDGRPWAYHGFLWAGFWDMVAQILR